MGSLEFNGFQTRGANLGAGADISLDLCGFLFFSLGKIKAGLQGHPVFGGVFKVTRQAQRGFGGDPPPPPDDVGDAVGRHPERQSQGRRGKIGRGHKRVFQDDPGVRGF